MSSFVRVRATAVCLLALLAAAAAWAIEPPSAASPGRLVEAIACPPEPALTSEAWVERRKARYAQEQEAAKSEGFALTTPLTLMSKEEFERRTETAKGIDCRRLVYLSDGLKVVAYEWKPKVRGADKLPLIIWNRGGNRDFGQNSPWQSERRFALDGFVVLASQYRGNDGGEGKEEFGGADVHDVSNLLPLAESFGYVDMDNVFMLGWSRGAMMTLLALKQGMKVNAAAVGGTPADITAVSADRAAMETMVFAELIPGYAEHRDQSLRDRSPVYWADRIEAPLLIFHGGADWRVKTDQALSLAQALQRAGKTYELTIYAGDDHGVSAHRDETDRRIVDWFRRYMKK
jgi:dipeptidyl aminopeptidase/acylaminoacyl peptidase